MPVEHGVDTHALVWYLEGNPRLGPNAKLVLDDPASRLFLPITALAEACWMVEHGRSTVPTVGHLLADVDADPRLTVIPLDRDILNLSLTLTGIGELHDRQIVATTLRQVQNGPVPLLTRDGNIQQSGPVTVIW